MRTNYHTHSDFCDGRASMAVMAEAAHERGYSVLGFSSHSPIPLPSTCNMPLARMEEYVATTKALAREWAAREGGMEILLGLEVDWIEGLCSPRDAFLEPFGLEFLIGSVHYIETEYGEAFTVDEPENEFAAHLADLAGGDASKVWKAYYRNLCSMIDEGGFDILGHFDLVRKNNKDGRWFDEDGSDYLEAALEATRLLEGRDIVVEVNLGGMARGKTDSPYPSLSILRELRELGVPITFSADAHAPSHLGAHLEDAKLLAREAGYACVSVLTKGRWIEVGIEET